MRNKSSRILFFTMAIVVCLGCQKKNSGLFSIYVDASNGSQACLSEIAERVDRVELETTDGSLIRLIDYVEITDNHYFVFNGVFSEVLMFDRDGRFEKPVGHIGRGPGEYTGVLQNIVDTESRQLLLNTRQGIMVFDEEGAYVKNVALNFIPTFMFLHNRQLYCLHTHADWSESPETSVLLTTHNTTDWKLVDSIHFISYSEMFMPNAAANFFSGSKRSVYFFPGVLALFAEQRRGADTLYVFEKQKLTPYLTVQFTGDEKEKRGVVNVVMTDNYSIITHALSVMSADSPYPKSVRSQYYIDLSTMKGKNAPNGFIDDFYGGDNVIIYPIPNKNMFFYYKENEYSPDLKTEPNPTLYVGTFKNHANQ